MFCFLKKWFEPRAFNQGYLPEKNGHKVFYSEYGNPKGMPILVFHGGPGGGARPRHAMFANLNKYRIIMFDQRGCNNSQPLGKLENNTTNDLIDDADRLLNYLKINDKIILRGASWGSTLALLFAEKYPARIEKMLLSQIFMADKDNAWWEFEGCRWHYPDFVEDLECKAKGDIPKYFANEINSRNIKKQLDAANFYGWYERVCCSLNPRWNNCTKLDEKTLAELRIFMHYRVNDFFMKSDCDILKDIKKIKDIPTVIVHNRLDFVCPVKGAYELHKALRKSRLVIVPEFGHCGKLLFKTIKRIFCDELS
ncbi:MAG: alpha/beta fold hydrolase [Alphaproteobacteria bacterium]|nr:alpha/beta fold hydrolase [Alphaproteobacteria bacterium]